jgi:hypothetical protein
MKHWSVSTYSYILEDVIKYIGLKEEVDLQGVNEIVEI